MTEAVTQLGKVNQAINDKEGKYLTFALGREEYGLEILKVREIIGYMEITSVPQTPDYIKGVINLRGNAVPLIDLRIKFNQPTDHRQFKTTVLVIQATIGKDNMRLGVLVDETAGVAELDGIKEPTDLAHTGKEGRDYISGMWIGPDKDLVMILDPDRLFVEDDFSTTT